MARKKVEETSIYETWAAVDAALADLADANRRKDAIEAKAAAQIADITKTKTEAVAPLAERIAIADQNIKLYVMAHQDELTGRSRDLNHGSVGIRKTPPALATLKGFTWGSILKVIKTKLETARGAAKKRFEDMLDTPEPKLDKVAIKGMDLSPADLAEIGMQIVQSDEVYITIPDPETKPT